MRTTGGSVAVAALGLAFVGSAVAEEGDPLDGLEVVDDEVHATTLDNGMTVVVAEDPSRPRVAMVLRYAVGSADDPPGHSGLAHLTEHCMFEGSRHLGPRDVHDLLARAGASEVNATTEADSTDYYAVVPRRNLELALWIEADRMATMLEALDADTVERAREIVLAEWRTKVGRVAAGQIWRWLFDALYPPGHRYRRVADRREEIARLTLDDVRWFHQRWYRPDHATLALVGDVTAEDAFAMARRYFGGVRATAVRPGAWEPRAASPPDLPTATTIDVVAPVVEAEALVAWRTPPYLAPGDAALDVVATLLAGGSRPMLQAHFEQRGLFPRWIDALQSSARDGSSFVVRVGGNDHDALDDLVAGVDAVIAQLRRDGPTVEQFEAARAAWLRRELGVVEQALGRAEFLAELAQRGEPPRTRWAHEVERYRRVTRGAVHDALRRYLSPERRVLVRVGVDPYTPMGGRRVRSQGGAW